MLNKTFDEFNNAYGIEAKQVDSDMLSKTYRMITSEAKELQEEIDLAELTGKLNKANSVKEIIDVVYSACQKLREMGVDVDAALGEVHRSNMSKVLRTDSPMALNEELSLAVKRYPDVELLQCDGGYVMYSQDQKKVIKPSRSFYSEADITPEMYGE